MSAASVEPVFLNYAEPLVYSFVSTVTRFSGFFYQCYLIPLALAILVLSLDDRKRLKPGRIALSMLAFCAAAALIYFIVSPRIGEFTRIGSFSHVVLLFLIMVYAVCFSPIQPHIRVVVAATVIAEINWAQSICTQVFMPVMSGDLSNILQFLLLAAALTVIVLFRPKSSDRIPRAYWMTMLAIALISVVCLFLIRAVSGRQNMPPMPNIAANLMLPAFFVVNLLIYYLYHVLLKEHRRASEMATMQAKLAQDLEFYQRSDSLSREYHSLRHELKNHFAVMETMLRDKQYDKLEAYFADYAGRTLPKLEEFRCPNPLLTSLINHHIATAAAAGVRLDVIAAVPERVGIADDDLCSLLSNMIDNGVEGCLRAGGELVKATLHTEKNSLFISVANPAADDVLTENPKLLTTKKNPQAHGFGIPIIRRIADKYDGAVSFAAEKGWFTADAMLYMEERPNEDA